MAVVAWIKLCNLRVVRSAVIIVSCDNKVGIGVQKGQKKVLLFCVTLLEWIGVLVRVVPLFCVVLI